MRSTAGVWAVVLAGGEGTRLREMTTTVSGEVVPKQFCSLQGQTCLLEDAINRAEAIAPPDHVCSVVAEKHRHWWRRALTALPAQNIFIEPQNRGTAHGILLALLKIERRAPAAVVLLLPADHYVADEVTLARSLRMVTKLAATDEAGLVYLLGVEPDRPDQELGYIVPDQQGRTIASEVLLFAEKPTSERAGELIRGGALWNTFIFAGHVRSLLNLFESRFGPTLRAMRCALGLAQQQLTRPVALQLLYAELESRDFSRDVLQRHERKLQVMRVPQCGWSDLGTPRRVAEVMRNIEQGRSNAVVHEPGAGYWRLARGRPTDLPRAS